MPAIKTIAASTPLPAASIDTANQWLRREVYGLSNHRVIKWQNHGGANIGQHRRESL